MKFYFLLVGKYSILYFHTLDLDSQIFLFNTLFQLKENLKLKLVDQVLLDCISDKDNYTQDNITKTLSFIQNIWEVLCTMNIDFFFEMCLHIPNFTQELITFLLDFLPHSLEYLIETEYCSHLPINFMVLRIIS